MQPSTDQQGDGANEHPEFGHFRTFKERKTSKQTAMHSKCGNTIYSVVHMNNEQQSWTLFSFSWLDDTKQWPHFQGRPLFSCCSINKRWERKKIILLLVGLSLAQMIVARPELTESKVISILSSAKPRPKIGMLFCTIHSFYVISLKKM